MLKNCTKRARGTLSYILNCLCIVSLILLFSAKNLFSVWDAARKQNKLASETKLQDLKSNMGILGKEAAAAMSAVEAQQQRLTLQRLIAMVMQSALLFNQSFCACILCAWNQIWKLTFFGFSPDCFQGWIRTNLSSESSSDTWSAWRRGMQLLWSFKPTRPLPFKSFTIHLVHPYY